MFSVYILYSVSSDKYYVGYTDDVARRLAEHNFNDHTTYTSKHRPWILKKFISIGIERSLAMRFERAIKKSKSRMILERIIKDVQTVEELAQLVIPIYRDDASGLIRGVAVRAPTRRQASPTEM
jgi:putative endonuclease